MTRLTIPEQIQKEQDRRGRTAWEMGRFGPGRRKNNLLFGHMYEDVERIESRYFPAGARVFAIASAGTTALTLAESHEVTAVDLNPVQLAYAEVRAHGTPARAGVAERLMAHGRWLFALMGWNPQNLKRFLTLEDPREQLRYWQERLDTQMFRAGMKVLFSPMVLRAAYAPGFLNCLPRQFGEVMRLRLERCWATHPNRRNPYAHALLLGEFGGLPQPRQATNIRFAAADAASYLESCPPGCFDAFTFSNILDGASQTYRRRLFEAAQRAASPAAVVVLRSFAEPSGYEYHNAAVEDRSPLWGVVDVRPAASLDA